MKYSTVNNREAMAANMRLIELIQAKKVVEIKEIKPRRSLNQNSYLHLLLGAFGVHFGYSLEEAKAIYKSLSPDVYRYEKEVRGKTHEFWRSSADLDKAEMTKTIDKLREMSKLAGYPLPAATDQEWLRQVENEMERAQAYL